MLPAQNLLDNGGFEAMNICTEYNVACAPESWFNIRPANIPLVNARLAPKPLLGDNVLLLPMYDVNRRSRPLVYTMLLCPLQKGRDYKLSFYVHTARRKFYNIDIAFLNKEPVTIGFDPYSVKPDVRINETDIVANIKGWSAVERLFTASDDAAFMLIGNIASFDDMSYKQADGMNKAGMIYYFVDEIVLRPLIAAPPCKAMSDNRQKMLSQHLRHTEYVVAENAMSSDTPELITDTIVLPAVLFKTNSAVIDNAFAGMIDSVVTKLSQLNIQSMLIIGHTDNKGAYENNIVLSKNRAMAVHQYMLARHPFSNVSTEGKADTVPVADNNSAAGRSRNRRVEIVVSYLKK